LIRDGNGARSFETLLRYRSAAMAEFWRALRTLKALQAEQALQAERTQTARRPTLTPMRPAAPPLAAAQQSNKPERAPRRDVRASEPTAPAVLHEPAARWLSNEPENAAAPLAPAPLADVDRPARVTPSGRVCRM
jgi:hypothetical protein